MAINARVSAQVKRLLQSLGTKEFDKEKERYWQVVEEEYRKDPEAAWGWLGYADPTDGLREAVMNEEDKSWVAERLEDYKRFWSMVHSVNDVRVSKIDLDLVRMAEEYIKA